MAIPINEDPNFPKCNYDSLCIKMFGGGSSFGKSLRCAIIPLAATVPAVASAIHARSLRPKDYDDFECEPVIRCRPPSIQRLCEQTKFSKKEIQIMYRAFKQGCPTGTVMKNEFQEVYAQFFPQGSASKYADLVFRTFDIDNDGSISFEEFVVGLSVISRGSVLEKLEWIFSLYDICRRGYIGYNELLQVVRAIYELLGSNAVPPVSSSHIKQHVSDLFQRMDSNNDGIISREEFIVMCQQDTKLCASLALFDTQL